MSGRKDDCCVGEPAMGDPRGLHSPDCPVYLASMDALERRTQPRRIEASFDLPGGESTSARLRQVQADLAASQADPTRVERERDAALDDRDFHRHAAHAALADVERIARTTDFVRAELASARQELEQLREEVRILKHSEGMEVVAATAELNRLHAALDEIRILHTDSVAGFCPSCYRAADVSDTDDGLVAYPCPTLVAIQGVVDLAALATRPNSSEADRG